MLTSEGFRPGLCPAGCIRELATHHPSFCSSFHQAGALVPEADAQTCWVRSGGRSRGPQTYHHHRATKNPWGDGQGAPTLRPEDQTLPRPDLGSEPLSAKAGRQENTKTARSELWTSGCQEMVLPAAPGQPFRVGITNPFLLRKQTLRSPVTSPTSQDSSYRAISF